MQLLLHTDILLNSCTAAADPKGDKLLERCRHKTLKAWVTGAALAAVAEKVRGKPGAEKLEDWLSVVAILPLTAGEIRNSLFTTDCDLEEALSVQAAQALGLAGIITLNPAAFARTEAKTYRPQAALEFLETRDATQAVPLIDLPAAYHEFWEDMEKEMADVLRSGHFILGPKVADLEAQVAAYCQCKYAVGVSSGTDALLISLMAAGICPGDDVITTPYTFFATLGCITRLGARPLLVDIDPESYNIDPDDVAGKITERTRAIIPVHLYGQCADMDPILEVADKFQMTVIEDAAQAIGSEYKFKRAGSLGDYGCFSFFPTKNLGGFGDGGIVTTNSEESYERLKLLRVHGSKPKYCHKVVGGNFRLDALQAAVVSAKLKYLEGWTEKRRQHAENYGRLFEQHGLAKKIILPKEIFPRHIYNQYVIRVPQGRDKLMVFLKEKGIGVEIYYPVPMHLQECFAVFGCKKGDCPNSELAAEQTLALPISPELSPEQQEYVVESIKGFVVNHTELGEA